MVVRLKDLDSGETSPKRKLVRMSDLEQPEQAPIQQGYSMVDRSAEEPYRPEKQETKSTLPGRDVPVIGHILRAADWVASNPVSEAIAEYTVPDAPMISGYGEQSGNARDTFLERSGQAPAEGVSKVIGQVAAPFFVPGGQLGTGNQVFNATSQALKQAPQVGRTGNAVIQGMVGGAAAGLGTELAQGSGELDEAARAAGTGASFGILGGAALGGAAAGLGKIGSKYEGTRIGDFLNRYFNEPVNTPELVQPSAEPTPLLALPSPRVDARMAAARQRGNLSPGAESVVPTVDMPINALPMGNYIRPTRLSVDAESMLNSVMARIKPEVDAQIAALRQVGESVDVPELAFAAARKYGYDLPSLLDGKTPSIANRVAKDASERAYGVYPESLPNVNRPEGFNISARGQAEGPVLRTGFRTSKTPRQQQVQTSAVTKQAGEVKPLPANTRQPASTIKDEPKFINTVKTSPNTAEPLATKLNETPIVGARTSDVMNRQQAQSMIDKYGREGLYSKLLAKRTKLSPSEVTAAQMLAKHYSSQGGEQNLSKAIEIISKTAREGREMGQAIQALSQWNKLDAEGALLLGERQLNRGVSDTSEWRKLTTAQAAPIQEAAQRIGTAQEAKSLADEVLAIVTNKKAGEALTDAEKATIKRFQEQVKDINEKTKQFLPKPKSSTAETIEKVRNIKPKDRTRDQVVSFLDAKAEQARQRLARSRNVGFASQLNNPVLDYAIIGASHIARGVRNLADYSELMIQDFGDTVKPHLKEAFLKSVNMFRKENGLPTVEELDKVVRAAIKKNELDEDTSQALKVMATEIGFIADKNLKLEATQDLQKAIKALGTSTLGEKIATLQTGAQLLNVVTIGRNVIGNAAQMLTEKLNKLAAVPIDLALSKFTGERTIQFLPKNQESMWRNFLLGTKSGWEGVSPTGTLSSYDIHPNVFGDRNLLKYVTKLLGASMQGFDLAAYRAAYGDVVATYAEQLGKAQGLTKAQIKDQMPKLIEQLDQRIHDMADEAGLYATFQDETMLSKGAEMLKRGLNKLTDKPAQMLVERGVLPKSLSTEGFGVGDIVLKYARTPANLIMRGIDYSPIGIFRAAMDLAPLFLNRSKFNQFAATRTLSRAITGSLGLTGLGYILAERGILTGSASMDPDARSIQEQSGEGAYKVNWSALGRFLTSGFERDAAKYQPGDTLMDYAWLQPAAISLAMGVNANKAGNNPENIDASGWKIAYDGLLGGLSSILENPMVQGLNNVIDAGIELAKQGKTDKAENLIKGVPASFVPTLFNQARTATDNKQRETFDESLLTEMLNMVKNKVPGLSQTLPVSYNSLGKPRERIQGGADNTIGQYLTSFFSPARITEYNVSPEAKLVLDVMNQSGDKNVLPRVSDKYIMVTDPVTKKDKKIDLTAEQFSKLQNKMGEEVERKLRLSAGRLSNPSIKMETKVDIIKDILNEVGQKARNDVRQELGFPKKQVR